jgi:hypothetical protein
MKKKYVKNHGWLAKNRAFFAFFTSVFGKTRALKKTNFTG